MVTGRRPFSGLGYGGWIRLARMLTGVLLGAYLLVSLATRGLFEYAGNDFRAFRAAAEVAREEGFSRVYNLEALAPREKDLMRWAAAPVQADFEVVPVPYLPVFILPFLLLLTVPPPVGFALWTALNAVLMWIALGSVTRSRQRGFIGPAFLSLPVFLTLLFGQVNAWLMTGLAGFLLSLDDRRDLTAGLWLGLLLVKPQVLVLFILGLAVARRWRALVGLAIAGLAALVISVALAGWGGLGDLLALVLRYPANLATTFPESMMNWRALGVLLDPVAGSAVAWGVAGVGLVATVAASAFLAAHCSPRKDAASQAVLTLGLFSASCAVAWHSHVHLAAPLLVPLTWLAAHDEWPRWRYDAWVLLPSAVFSLVGLAAGAGAAHRIGGMVMLILNVALILGALQSISRPEHLRRSPSEI